MAVTSTSNPSFSQRSGQIIRARRKVARQGGALHLGPDCLLIVRPRRGGTGIPFRGLLLIAALLFGAKALMLVQDGAVTYGDRVAALAEGGAVGQAGAWLMQADPLSVALAGYIGPLLR